MVIKSGFCHEDLHTVCVLFNEHTTCGCQCHERVAKDTLDIRSTYCRNGEHRFCSGDAAWDIFPCRCECHKKEEDMLSLSCMNERHEVCDGYSHNAHTTLRCTCACHTPENDPVNHPKHYTSDPSGIECIEITRHRNFNVGNAIKYLWRAGLKTGSVDPKVKQIEDLEKAIWYIKDEICRVIQEDENVASS